MRKKIFAATVIMAFALSACGNQAGEDGGNLAESAGTADMAGSAKSSAGISGWDESITAIQEGSAGAIQVVLPEGWAYEVCPEGSDLLQVGDYGLHFYPENVSEGFVELCYKGFFGVCGTGLEQEKVTLAGDRANIGTYDNGDNWDFVSFHGSNEGIVALTFAVESWWPEYGDQVLEILDTVCLKQDSSDGAVPETGTASGSGTAAASDPDAGAGIRTIACGTNQEPAETSKEDGKEDSRIQELGLSLEVTECTSKGATLVFRQSGGSPTGELSYGAAYRIERCEDGEWVEVPVAFTGNYGFEMMAYIIPLGEDREFQIDWEWLYGELEPGEYRIRKDVDDFRKTADYDVYEIYAYFELSL